MRNSLKLGIVVALTGTVAAFAGCSSDNAQTDGGAGAATAGAFTGTAGSGTAGATIIIGTGTAGSGTAGEGTAGSGTAGEGTAGAGTAGAGTAGAGTGGAGGAATAGAGGAAAGSAGAAGASTAGAGGAAAGAGGAAGSTGVTCADESTGVGTGSGVITAVVLIDDVVVTKGAATASQWQFADATKISDVGAGDAPPADMWSRVNYADAARVSGSASAHDAFISCAGNPAAGSLKNIIPFTADSQYYQVRVVGAAADLSGATITANVKLVGGGRPVPACAAGAFLYAVDNTSFASTHMAADPFTPLKAGVWTPITLTVPATGFTTVGQIAVQISTYSCGAGM